MVTHNDHSLAQFLASQSCTAVEKANGKVPFVLWLALGTLGASYICLLFANLVHRYLVPLLRSLSIRLKLTDDLVGIAFLGIASGLPALAIHGYAAIQGSPVGIGSVFGGMILNLTLGVGIVALVATHTIPLNAKYMARDSLFFLMVFGFILILFTYQMFVTVVEAAAMVILYITFIAILVATRERKDSDHHDKATTTPSTLASNERHLPNDNNDTDEIDAEVQPLLAQSMTSSTASSASSEASLPLATSSTVDASSSSPSNTITVVSPVTTPSPPPSTPSSTSVVASPSRPFAQILVDLAALPFDWLFHYTIPSCDTPSNGHRWPITYAVTLLFSFAFAYTLVNGVFYLICKLGIETSLSGKLILSIGPALPSSMVVALVARAGMGNMALSGLLGSSIFALLLGLGLPWLLYTIMYGDLHLPLYSLTIGAIIVGVTFLCSALGLLLNGWKLRPLLALIPILLYGVFVALDMMASQAN